MKNFTLWILISLISTLSIAEVGSPIDEKYRARFTHYSCRSFKDKAVSPEFMTRLELKFGHLGVDQTLDHAVLNLISTNEEGCEYRIRYVRNRETRNLELLETSMLGGESCFDKEAELAEIFAGGFMYGAKYMYYFALKFNSKFSNSCETSTGNFIAEFELGL